jgi:phosphatidyl-myo-inositol dimannoside synthase
MRLLVVTNDFPPTVGGIENYIYSLVKRWPSDEVLVVTRDVPGSKDFDALQQFEILRLETETLMPTRDLVGSVKELVKQRSIDAVHFPSSMPLGLMGNKLGRPYALSVHGGEFRLASRLPVTRALLKRVCAGASLILPESSFASRLVTDLMGESTVLSTVTCGVDADRYGKAVAPAVELGVPGPVIACVSRLVPRKGPRTLIRSLPAVHRAHPSVHLLIVGGGPDLKALKKLAGRRGVAESVTFAGPQPWEKIPSYYSAGDIFALPTRSRFLGTETEGLPLVFVEAAAASLPLIGGNCGGVSDAVREGETGFLVDGSVPQESAEAIIRLLDEPEKMRCMGASARRMVEEDFTWDAVARTYRASMLEHCR